MRTRGRKVDILRFFSRCTVETDEEICPRNPIDAMTHQSDKQEATTAAQLAELLRGEILAGRLAPGARMPSHRDVTHRYRCSGLTVQVAMDLLAEEGFIQVATRSATRVHPRPPHRHRILVVFIGRSGPLRPGWSSLFELLWQFCTRFRSDQNLDLFPIGDVDDDPEQGEALRLVRLATHRACAGVLLTVYPRNRPRLCVALKATGIPLAVISDTPLDFLTVVLDEVAWWRKGIQEAARQGCRRLAVIINQRVDDDTWQQKIHDFVAEVDLELPDYLVHELPIGLTGEQQRLGELLGHLGPDHVPDAILVLDDNLVMGVCQGLARTALRPLILAHANFPDPPPAPLPALRFGPDVQEILSLGCSLLTTTGSTFRQTGIRLIPD